MTAYIVVCIAALLTAGLTLYSGFGLGTLLMPVFAIFFPIEVAVAATAAVHCANNVFKIILVGKHADRAIVLRFGIPALLAALVGAVALDYVSHFGEITHYSIGPRTATITPIKLVMAVLVFVFALFELLPRFRDLKFERKHLAIGGLLSGFFGGFSGHQGALRSAFLVKVGISTEAYVGTNAAIAFLVDMARLSTYAVLFFLGQKEAQITAAQWPLILTGIVAAFLGVILGKRFLHKITMQTVQNLTGVLLLGIALALGLGII